jgi:hypothetical protein
MDLYSTKVLSSAEDRLWELPADLPDLSKARLLVVSMPFEAGSAEHQTLTKMMAACKLSPDEFVILQLHPGEKLSWHMLAGAGAPRRVLMLGISPARLAISAMFRLNYCNAFLGGAFIPGYSLPQMEQNPAAKRELWEQGLKPCFGL